MSNLTSSDPVSVHHRLWGHRNSACKSCNQGTIVSLDTQSLILEDIIDSHTLYYAEHAALNTGHLGTDIPRLREICHGSEMPPTASIAQGVAPHSDM